ncbi:PREDICTED: uncharacterized protein LOC109356244 [Lupinus angustifolius]|uniref:uncharacterized protein LOC109356244 n=1 Tax=Lupinus angustifolius TaxID=3871 RepID=UPI00092F554C|nr:PREDICTED: uncharacterized protein LOC109356244 [Lupinus angustifolius]
MVSELFQKSSAIYKNVHHYLFKSSIGLFKSSKPFTRSNFSLLHTHPSENPASAMVSPLLNGDNYHQWSKSMKMSLISKQKLEFVDGSIQTPPKTDPIYKAWERTNNIVISWITRLVNPSISQSILWMDKAHDVWDDLHERYSQGNLLKIAELQDSVARFKQGNLNVSEYFT